MNNSKLEHLEYIFWGNKISLRRKNSEIAKRISTKTDFYFKLDAFTTKVD